MFTAIVPALHLCKSTSLQLAFSLRADIQMAAQYIQCTPPLTPTFTVSAVDLQLFEGDVVSTVVDKCESFLTAERAALTIPLNTLDALFAEVVTTAACQVRGAKDYQTDWTLSLEVIWRRVNECVR